MSNFVLNILTFGKNNDAPHPVFGHTQPVDIFTTHVGGLTALSKPVKSGSANFTNPCGG
jgi:hypothetical protein